MDLWGLEPQTSSGAGEALKNSAKEPFITNIFLPEAFQMNASLLKMGCEIWTFIHWFLA
jgi:hypothetical protein